MPRHVSLAAREAFNAAATEDTPIVLIKVSHADWDEPIYLASDWTVRTSLEPLKFGVVSNGITYDFVVMSAVLPDDNDSSPAQAELVFATLNDVADAAGIDLQGGIVAAVRELVDAATVDMSVVLASSPDDVEIAYTGLLATRAAYPSDRVSVTLSREPMVTEPWPALRATKELMPNLFA